MISSEASCSDCRLEFIQKKWTKLLLKWINRCVYEKNNSTRQNLSFRCLSDIMTKYNRDVCDDDIDRALLCTDDLEPFLKYKYPILRLRYLSEEQDLPKKLYIMTSMLLYHCCLNSHEGIVHADIYSQLNKYEQELVLKFCERLNDMETTLSNVELAIQEAFESIDKRKDTEITSGETSFEIFKRRKSSVSVGEMSSASTLKSSFATLQSNVTLVDENLVVAPSTKLPPMKFKSSITVMPSVVTDVSSYSSSGVGDSEDRSSLANESVYVDSDQIDNYFPKTKKILNLAKEDKARSGQRSDKVGEIMGQTDNIAKKIDATPQRDFKKEEVADQKESDDKEDDTHSIDSKTGRCRSNCSCTKCSVSGPCCGDPGSSPGLCACDTEKPLRHKPSKLARLRINRKITALLVAFGLFVVVITFLNSIVSMLKEKKEPKPKVYLRVESLMDRRPLLQDGWKCTKNLCQKVYQPANEKIYPSYSRCVLQCTGPQLWPHPIGNTEFSSKVIALATNKLEYKLKTIPSEFVQRYSAEALKLFIASLAKLETSGKRYKTRTLDLDVKKMYIQMDVESDADPRLRLNTEEAYRLTIETNESQVVIKISSSSFCGVRHGLETLTQMILLDESTGYLISVSSADIKDAPSYKYRGLMIDTGRNFIPVTDLMRTIDAMATVKLNTFHWRISDVTSFPMLLPKLPQLFEYGAYDRSMMYTKNDVEAVVKRAGVRGIRVLIEVAVPGPVGRAWSWSSGAGCPSRKNDSCDNILCTILDSSETVMKVLQDLYEDILELSQVDDVFHLSNGLFSLSNCFNLMNHRDGYLDKALDTLKRANKGFLPKLPIVWYTPYLNQDFESRTWERFGVQLNDWKSNPSEHFLAKFRAIHSSKWELSCEMKKQRCRRYRSWQEMYAWKSWRNLEAFTVEGGEAVLWTDLVNAGNLDYHLWPRTAAVAERLWSDIIANGTADPSVYVRLNSQRSRMMHVGAKVQPIWPAWCTSNLGVCLEKVQTR